jgi:ABC-type cobalamin/Fe3+-siderophores transport system ATPase subunit
VKEHRDTITKATHKIKHLIKLADYFICLVHCHCREHGSTQEDMVLERLLRVLNLEPQQEERN